MQSKLATPRVHSVNVSGAPKSILFAGHRVTPGFFKQSRSGVAYAEKLGLAGDAQADLSVHGGPEKAV